MVCLEFLESGIGRGMSVACGVGVWTDSGSAHGGPILDFRRSWPSIAFVYAFPIFKTAQAAQSKFGKLHALLYTKISTTRQISSRQPVTGMA
jgi:hypothetical protein